MIYIDANVTAKNNDKKHEYETKKKQEKKILFKHFKYVFFSNEVKTLGIQNLEYSQKLDSRYSPNKV